MASPLPRSAACVSVFEDASSSVAADDTVSMISPTAPSKLSASRCMSALRCWRPRASASTCSVRSRSASAMLVLNTSTAPAISPISSLRPMPGTEIESSPRASRVIAPTMPASAFEIERPRRKPTAASTTTAMAKATIIHMRTASRVAASATSACLYRPSTVLRTSTIPGSSSRNVFIMLASRAALCCAVSAHAANSDWYFCSLAVMSFITAVGTATTSIALENSAAAFFISAMYFGSRRSMKSFSCRRIISIQLVAWDRRSP